MKPLLLSLGLIFAWLAAARADDELERSEATLLECKREAARYVIRRSAPEGAVAVLREESLLKWQNTVDKSVHGNIFLWTHQGRPEVIASLYRFYSPKTQFDAEFQSLSRGPLAMSRDDQEIWTPRTAGVELTAFSGEAAPSDSASHRLIQIRRLAERFSAQMTDWSGEDYRLRLMRQPLYRYESQDPDLLDGAMLSFTYTTDPEVLLLIEAHRSPAGFQWMYGFARLNVGELRVSLGDKEIWRAERLEKFMHQDGVYSLFMDVPTSGPPNKPGASSKPGKPSNPD